MRSLNKRLEALEVAAAPFEPRPCHLIGLDAGQTEAEAIAAYGKPVGPDDLVIFLCGVEPSVGLRGSGKAVSGDHI